MFLNKISNCFTFIDFFNIIKECLLLYVDLLDFAVVEDSSTSNQ